MHPKGSMPLCFDIFGGEGRLPGGANQDYDLNQDAICFLFDKIALLSLAIGRRLTKFASVPSGFVACFLPKWPGVPAAHPPGLSRRARCLADGGRVFTKIAAFCRHGN